jgi:flap endonuclease-1
MLQNLSKSQRRKVQGRWIYQKITPFEISLKTTLTNMGIDLFQLVDMAILIGTDYFKGIKNIGPKTALKLIIQHKNIESVINKIRNKYDFSNITPDIILKVRKIFLFPEVRMIKEFSWNYPNEVQVFELFFEEHNLERERMENNLNKFITNFEKCQKHFEIYKEEPRRVQKTII